MGLALGMDLTFYPSMEKRLKLKVRMFYGLIPTFVEFTAEKLVGDLFAPLPSPLSILNRVKNDFNLTKKVSRKSLDFFGHCVLILFFQFFRVVRNFSGCKNFLLLLEFSPTVRICSCFENSLVLREFSLVARILHPLVDYTDSLLVNHAKHVLVDYPGSRLFILLQARSLQSKI